MNKWKKRIIFYTRKKIDKLIHRLPIWFVILYIWRKILKKDFKTGLKPVKKNIDECPIRDSKGNIIT